MFEFPVSLIFLHISRLSDYGAAFTEFNDELKIVSARPKCRLWISDLQGEVEQTLVFKDAIKAQTPNIPILNPTKCPMRIASTFGRLYKFLDKFLITVANDILFVLNFHEMKIDGILTDLRRYICVQRKQL
jgi:hypothetical protein